MSFCVDSFNMVLSKYSNTQLINMCILVYDILDINHDANNLRFVKNEIIINKISSKLPDFYKQFLEMHIKSTRSTKSAKQLQIDKLNYGLKAKEVPEKRSRKDSIIKKTSIGVTLVTVITACMTCTYVGLLIKAFTKGNYSSGRSAINSYLKAVEHAGQMLNEQGILKSKQLIARIVDTIYRVIFNTRSNNAKISIAEELGRLDNDTYGSFNRMMMNYILLTYNCGHSTLDIKKMISIMNAYYFAISNHMIKLISYLSQSNQKFINLEDVNNSLMLILTQISEEIPSVVLKTFDIQLSKSHKEHSTKDVKKALRMYFELFISDKDESPEDIDKLISELYQERHIVSPSGGSPIVYSDIKINELIKDIYPDSINGPQLASMLKTAKFIQIHNLLRFTTSIEGLMNKYGANIFNDPAFIFDLRKTVSESARFNRSFINNFKLSFERLNLTDDTILLFINHGIIDTEHIEKSSFRAPLRKGTFNISELEHFKNWIKMYKENPYKDEDVIKNAFIRHHLDNAVSINSEKMLQDAAIALNLSFDMNADAVKAYAPKGYTSGNNKIDEVEEFVDNMRDKIGFCRNNYTYYDLLRIIENHIKQYSPGKYAATPAATTTPPVSTSP